MPNCLFLPLLSGKALIKFSEGDWWTGSRKEKKEKEKFKKFEHLLQKLTRRLHTHLE
jgi:hypothetical protein